MVPVAWIQTVTSIRLHVAVLHLALERVLVVVHFDLPMDFILVNSDFFTHRRRESRSHCKYREFYFCTIAWRDPFPVPSQRPALVGKVIRPQPNLKFSWRTWLSPLRIGYSAWVAGGTDSPDNSRGKSTTRWPPNRMLARIRILND